MGNFSEQNWGVSPERRQQVQVTVAMSECGLIAVGVTGTCVVSAQYWMNRFENAGLPLTGYFGPVTEAAVANYQASHGLTPDGIIGDQTRAAIADDFGVAVSFPANTYAAPQLVAPIFLGCPPGTSSYADPKWNCIANVRDDGNQGTGPLIGFRLGDDTFGLKKALDKHGLTLRP